MRVCGSGIEGIASVRMGFSSVAFLSFAEAAAFWLHCIVNICVFFNFLAFGLHLSYSVIVIIFFGKDLTLAASQSFRMAVASFTTQNLEYEFVL